MSKALLPIGIQQFFDDNGITLSGGKVYTYAGGTTTPKATYTDSTGGASNTNPIILDAAGRCFIWGDTGLYKFVITDANDVLIATVDNINTSSGSGVTGTAGGDLTGTYPNPTIGTKKVTAAKIDDSTITDTQIAAANKDGVAEIASMRTLGTGSNQACAGNDSRLSDSRAPTAHSQAWSTITSTPTTLAGYSISDAVASSDSRLSDARTPTAHATTHSSGNSDAVTVSNLAGNLTQARSHDSPDTDAGASSLHHTLGTGANQAAAGNHAHTEYLNKPELWYGKNSAFSVSLSTTPLILPVTGVFSSAAGLENAIDGSVHPITPVANKWYKIAYKVTMRQSIAKKINFAIKVNSTINEDSVFYACGGTPDHHSTTGFLLVEADAGFSYDDHISIVGYIDSGTENNTIDYFEWLIEAYDGMV